MVLFLAPHGFDSSYGGAREQPGIFTARLVDALYADASNGVRTPSIRRTFRIDGYVRTKEIATPLYDTGELPSKVRSKVWTLLGRYVRQVETESSRLIVACRCIVQEAD